MLSGVGVGGGGAGGGGDTEGDRHKTALHTGRCAKIFSVSPQCSAKIKRTPRVMGKDGGGGGGGQRQS